MSFWNTTGSLIKKHTWFVPIHLFFYFSSCLFGLTYPIVFQKHKLRQSYWIKNERAPSSKSASKQKKIMGLLKYQALFSFKATHSYFKCFNPRAALTVTDPGSLLSWYTGRHVEVSCRLARSWHEIISITKNITWGHGVRWRWQVRTFLISLLASRKQVARQILC